jgi:hypothetical protein
MKLAYLLLRYYTLVVALYEPHTGVLDRACVLLLFIDSLSLAGQACAKRSTFASLLIA